MNRHLWSRATAAFCAFACVVTICASVAFSDVKVDAEMRGMRGAANKPQSLPKGVAAFKAGASAGWGLWMEGEMAFRRGDAVLKPTELNLEWRDIEGRFLPAVATADGASRVVFSAFGEEDVLRLALWVAGRELLIPFSQPPEDHPARKLLKQHRYIPPTHGYTRLLTGPPVRLEERPAEREWSLLIHPVLDTPALVQAMGYIDFSDGDVERPRTRMVVVPHADGRQIIRELNELVDASGSGVSYTNADVHVNFVCDLVTGKLSGTPLRYYWSHDQDGHIQFHLVAKFIEPQSLPAEVPETLEVRQREAVELYRLASVFSAFADANRDELLRFIDEAFDRAKDE